MIGRRYRLNSLTTAGLFVLLGAASAMGQTAREVEDVFWRDVVCDRELEVRAYLKAYPDGAYVSEAWACLEQGLGLTRLERVAVQRGLAEVGQEPGPADGLFGGPETKTRQAIRTWQAAKGMAATGYLSREQADILIVTGQAVEERQRAAVAQAAQEEAARQAAAVDDAAYAAAEEADTAAAYGEYLEAYPAGRHTIEARAARETARRAEAERVAQRRARDAALRVGQTFRDALRSGGEGPEMVVVPAGRFQMGSPSYEEERNDAEGPVHRVMIGEAFAVGVYEVTRGEYERFVGATDHAAGNACYTDEEGKVEERAEPNWRDPGYRQSGEHPVVCVSWTDAYAYTAWLTRESGAEYRLLSEAEWEYVARGGTATARYWGEGEREQCRHANGADASTELDWKVSCNDGHAWTAPVGSYTKNGFGVSDVLGNVWEWVEDCWNGSYEGAPMDGTAWTSGNCDTRVLRGGSWFDIPWSLRSANRFRITSGIRINDLGFRVARRLTP